jgi:hypothetical protein
VEIPRISGVPSVTADTLYVSGDGGSERWILRMKMGDHARNTKVEQ